MHAGRCGGDVREGDEAGGAGGVFVHAQEREGGALHPARRGGAGLGDGSEDVMNTPDYKRSSERARRRLSVIFNRLTRTTDGNLYISYALDTPGCMAQGATIAEAERELEKAREDYLRDWWKEIRVVYRMRRESTQTVLLSPVALFPMWEIIRPGGAEESASQNSLPPLPDDLS